MFVSNRLFGAMKIGAVSCALCTTLACSSNGSGTGSGSTGAGNSQCISGQALTIEFPQMYSAYDGMHEFDLPAVVNGASGAAVRWSVSSPTVTFVTDEQTGGIMLTMRSADPPMVTVHAEVDTKNGTVCGDAPLTITAASEADWELGNSRYNNSNPLPTVPTNDAGLPQVNPAEFASGMNFLDPANAPPACTNCHGPTAMSGYLRDVSHTPQQTGGFSDMDLQGIFTQGVVPQGGYFDNTVIPYMFWQFFHKWSDITGEEATGMVVYLRSLAPAPQAGMADFNGMGGN